MEVLDFLGQNLYMILFFMLAGGIAGMTAGLFGIGGGVVIVPILYHFSDELGIPTEHKIQIIAATSLFMIAVNAIISAYFRNKYKEVDIKIFRKWFPALVTGAIAGACLNVFIKSSFVTVLFAMFCGFVAVKMFFNFSLPKLKEKIPSNDMTYSICGFLIACFSSLIGVGGGTLSVPALNAFNLPLKKATGTSTLFSATIAFSAGCVYATLGMLQASHLSFPQTGYVNWLALLFIIPASITGAVLGTKISNKISTALLRKLFAAVLFASAVKMICGIW